MAKLEVLDKANSSEAITHVALVLDSSGSMDRLAHQVVQVADTQIKFLAERSDHYNQETRATIYTFDSAIRCAYFDRDVKRFTSLASSYRIQGMTALGSATLNAIEDLEKTFTKYGRHSFLLFVLTDGQENASKPADLTELKRKLGTLSEEWTVAVLVPDEAGVQYARQLGFKPHNIQRWETTAQGLADVAKKIEIATDTYMGMRSVNASFVGTDNIWTLTPESLNKAVQVGVLEKIPYGKYTFYAVPNQDVLIRDFVEGVTGTKYKAGDAYYQLVSREEVQASKEIAVRDKKDGAIYKGAAARSLLKLPNHNVTISNTYTNDYDIFVQSRSYTRKLDAGTDVLVFH